MGSPTCYFGAYDEYVFSVIVLWIAFFSWDILVHVCRRKIYDEYNDEDVELTKEEIDLIRRIRDGRVPHAEVDPYEVVLLGLVY